MVDEVKRKRGRPRKSPLPEEVLKIIEEVKEKEEKEFHDIIVQEKLARKGEWDVRADDKIEFFDKNLSYELTGYKPITDTKGLDFDPSWFTVARDVYLKTGHYTQYRPKTKAYKTFWDAEYEKCINGVTINGYTITGDHYFFLNYYQLPLTETATKAGGGRSTGFPNFFVSQYEFFHYFELAKRLRKHVGLMKARGIGFSEINAAISACTYSTIRESVTMVTCYDKGKLERTLKKDWNALKFLDTHTDGGMFKLRQLSDTALVKKSGHYNNLNGAKVPAGWQSTIEGVIADDPQKIRGDRVDVLIYDEAGSWPDFRTAFIQGEALVAINGVRFGIKMAGGTGGDKGPALEGLKELYYDPNTYDVLPFKHNYTQDGSTILSAYFIPAFAQVNGFIDKRGYCDQKAAREYYEKERAKMVNSQKALLKYSAEYCFNAEEAFALEGENKFNKLLLADQLAKIRINKTCPNIETGYLSYRGEKKEESGFNWIKGKEGKIHILEHPIWVDSDETPIRNLYIAGIDSIDIGAQDTSALTEHPSDFCIMIKRRAFGNKEPQYVAYYKDRPDDIREAYKIAIRLVQYYNCMINIEATRVSMISWARDNGYIKYFMRRPSATLPDPLKRGGSRQFGSPATVAVIDHQTDLIRDYINDYCYNIWFEKMLDELIMYSDENKTKFDMVAAMGLTELGDEELVGTVPKKVVTEQNVTNDVGWYTDENGYKHWGIIPSKTPFNTLVNDSWYKRNNRLKTSDPRYS